MAYMLVIEREEFIMTTTNKHYLAGFYAVRKDIQGMGFEAARDKFNMDNPQGYDNSFSSMDAYQYAKGGIEALVKSIPSKEIV